MSGECCGKRRMMSCGVHPIKDRTQVLEELEVLCLRRKSSKAGVDETH